MKHDFSKPSLRSHQGAGSLYILGQSTDGPVQEPVRVTSLSEMRMLFGTGNLLDALEEALLVPNSIIYLVRVSGESSRIALLAKEDELFDALEFRSVYGGSRYNQIEIHMSDNELIIHFTDDLFGLAYPFGPNDTIGDLVEIINRDNYGRSGLVFAKTKHPYLLVKDMVPFNRTPKAMAQGEDGLLLSKNNLYQALGATYDILEGQPIDVICPYPARFDDAHPSFTYGDENASYGVATYANGEFLTLVEDGDPNLYATFYEQLIDFCRRQEASGMQTHGVIGTREMQEPHKMTSHYLGRLARANGLKDRYGLVDFEGNMIDKGYYLSIFMQEFVVDGKRFNGAATYAALIAKSEPTASITMMPLPKDIELAFELHPQELADLSYLGAVAARTSIKYGIVVANGVTAGLASSSLHQLINVRVAQTALRIVNESLDTLIGSTIIRGVTEREVESRLTEAFRYLYQEGILKDYSYQIVYLDESEQIEIRIEMTPRNMTQAIQAIAGVNVSGGMK